jgi:hypothetical protein
MSKGSISKKKKSDALKKGVRKMRKEKIKKFPVVDTISLHH